MNKDDKNTPAAPEKDIIVPIFLIVIGAAPFVILLVSAFDAFFNGFAVPFFGNQTKDYGWEAVENLVGLSLVGYAFIFIPAAILLIIGIVSLVSKKSKKK